VCDVEEKHVWERKKMHTKFLVEQHDGNRKLGRSWYKWEDDIKMDLKEIEWTSGALL
jgi:hypothetical protein